MHIIRLWQIATHSFIPRSLSRVKERHYFTSLRYFFKLCWISYSVHTCISHIYSSLNVSSTLHFSVELFFSLRTKCKMCRPAENHLQFLYEKPNQLKGTLWYPIQFHLCSFIFSHSFLGICFYELIKLLSELKYLITFFITKTSKE